MMKSSLNNRPRMRFGVVLAAGLVLVQAVWAGSLHVIPEAAFSGEVGLRVFHDDELPGVSLGDEFFTWVEDDTPNSEASYRFRMYVRFDGLVLQSGAAHIFMAGNSMGGSVLEVMAIRDGDDLRLSLAAFDNSGTDILLSMDDAPLLAPGWHQIEVAWNAGASGLAELYLDGEMAGIIDSIANGDQRIDFVRLGYVPGESIGSTGRGGFLDFDDFVSRTNSAQRIGTRPTSAGIADIRVNLGTASSMVDLFTVFDDAETEDADMVYTVDGNTNPGLFSSISVDVLNGILTLSYAAGARGNADITLRARDEDGLSVFETFNVLVNGPPATTGLEDVLVNQDSDDTIVPLMDAFDDEETGEASLTYSVANVSNGALFESVTIDEGTRSLVLNYASGAFGVSQVTVRATDPDGLSVDAAFMVTVDGAPTTTGIADILVNAGTPLSEVNLRAAFDDPETGPEGLMFSLVGNTNAALFSSAVVDPATGQLILVYAADVLGESDLTVRATDERGQFVETTFTVMVHVGNASPTTSGIANVVVNVNAPNTVIDLFASFDDEEDGAAGLTYTVQANTNPDLFESVTINEAAGTLTLAYAADQAGMAQITIRATDTGDLFVTASFSVRVNGPPVALGIDDVSVLVNAAATVVNLFGAFDDAEDTGAGLTYTVEENTNPGLFESVAIDGALGTLTLAYAAEQTGMAEITIRGTDTGGLFAETTFGVEVVGGPMTVGIMDVTVDTRTGFTAINLLDFFADSRGDDEALVFTLEGNTNQALFSLVVIDGAMLELTFAPGEMGTAELTIRATDENGLFVESTFSVTVEQARGRFAACSSGGAAGGPLPGGDGILAGLLVLGLMAAGRRRTV